MNGDGVVNFANLGVARVFQYTASPGDLPVIGDWNGNGRAKTGVFRGGLWILNVSGDGVMDYNNPGVNRVVGKWSSTIPPPGGTPSAFTLTLTPASQETVQGSSTAHTVILSAPPGFVGGVSLSASGVPPGTTPTFAGQSLQPGQSTTLTLHTANGTPVGPHEYTVFGSQGASSANVSGVIRVTGKTAPLVINSDNTVHIPVNANVWEPSSAAGNAWLTAWNTLNNNATASSTAE